MRTIEVQQVQRGRDEPEITIRIRNEQYTHQIVVSRTNAKALEKAINAARKNEIDGTKVIIEGQ